jgi:AraC family transcriptional regulator of adaptative response / DNA-3-methyladenine glycosylase II
MRLISDGVVDRQGVGGLAESLHYSARQLERHLMAEVGAGPLALARAQRAQTARLLVETTELSFSEIAFASGFSSVRQFNDTVKLVFATTPTDLRVRASGRLGASSPGNLSFRLPVRVPFDTDSLFGHLAATAIPGCEEVRDGSYRRTIKLPAGNCIAELTPAGDHVACRLRLDDMRDLPAAIARCRRLLDLDSDPEAVDSALSEDPLMSVAVRDSPGRRIPRSVDGDEMAVRVVLGQQVSLRAAATLAARLARSYGTPVSDPLGGLTHVFPSVGELAGLDPANLAMPTARARCLSGLVSALADGKVELDAGTDWERARSQLAEISGVGPWTIEMIAMRGLGDPDAFPASDIGAVRGAKSLGLPSGPQALTEHAKRWRPWRAYGVQHLWGANDHTVNHWPTDLKRSTR